jgi:CRISPR/Cas system CSM-associated protein Csm3 (group 7 of RAMP superfamily)
MGRHLGSRFELRATLRTVSALHVGTGGEERGVDLAVARDGAGEPHVPGTSLGGALRAWTAPAMGATDERWERLWGPQAERRDEGWASRVVVEDAPVRLPEDQAAEELRDGVTIDRRTGTASHRRKYERFVLPVGSTIDLTVGCDVEREYETEARELLQGLRRALRDRRVTLGAARSRGLGRVELVPDSDTLSREPLDGREAILAAVERRVRQAGPPLEMFPIDPASSRPRSSRLLFRLAWQPVGPLMVRAGMQGLAVDSLPLTARIEGGRTLLLPGSSIKGVLRSQADRIMCTLLEQSAASGVESSHELVAWVFGCAPGGGPDDSGRRGRAAAVVTAGQAALWVEDCLAEQPVAAEVWRRIEEARWISRAERDRDRKDGKSAVVEDEVATSDDPFDDTDMTAWEALHAAGLSGWDAATHVAIDRWTGGAADERLFSVLEPDEVLWDAIELALDFGRIERASWIPAVALLLLILGDLVRGVLPLGYATNRGLGSAEISEVSVSVEEGLREAVEAAAVFGWLAGTYAVSRERGFLAALDRVRLVSRVVSLRPKWYTFASGEDWPPEGGTGIDR